MTPTGDAWFTDAFQKAWREQDQRLGRFNLAIFGKTGVGKSTLVNAIFGEEVAATGIGEPVTQAEHLYLHRSGHLGVLDTRGLEVGKDNARIIDELRRYVGEMRHRPLEDQIHLAWYCVRAPDRRFEATEADFVRELKGLGLPVIVVLTQVPKAGDRFHPDAVELAERIRSQGLPVFEDRVFLTMAEPDEFSGQPAHGLTELLDATFRGAPDGVEQAITAAQKIDLGRKRRQSKSTIDGAAAAAAAAGATPIPFSDAAILIPIQIGMMAAVANIYGIGIERATMASVAATAAATTAGRSIVTNLVKFVPGVGTIIGGTINAGVAAAITYAMGNAWVVVCEQMAAGRLAGTGAAADKEAIHRVFMDEFTSQARRRLRGSA
jgi:uncharacterized protein (DUF697 family)/predicted GTPase